MRAGILPIVVVSSITSATAFADPAERIEATGYLGVDYLGADIGLGDSQAAEQRPQTAPTFGARLTYIALRAKRDIRADFGGELELSFAPSSTAASADGSRPSVFAPVFGYRALLVFRLGDGWLQPHVVGGIGGATLASSSKYMSVDTDLVLVWGGGVTLPMTDRWQLRFDAREGRTEASGGGMTSTFEVMLGIGARFGGSAKSARLEAELAKLDPRLGPDQDSDGDRIPDDLDACPYEAELFNGVEDNEGCPEDDPDGDGLIGAFDRCPGRAEDFDRFQDEDGCPDEDDDGDGIADARDVCPREAETKNGIADDDGCPDQVPASFVASLSAGSTIKFQGKATLTPSSKAALDRSITAMLANPQIKVSITAHPDAGPDSADLAARRAEAVKWYLVEQGVAQAQLVTAVGDPVTAPSPLIDLAVAP